jgi:hypothetical protein
MAALDNVVMRPNIMYFFEMAVIHSFWSAVGKLFAKKIAISNILTLFQAVSFSCQPIPVDAGSAGVHLPASGGNRPGVDFTNLRFGRNNFGLTTLVL